MLIKIEGAEQALKALRQLEPETAKEVGREVSNVGKGLAARIRSAAPVTQPMSGWVQTNGLRGSRGGRGWPGWTPISAASRRRGMQVFVNAVSSDPAIASIYETAGFQGGRSRAGKQMIANLNRGDGLTTVTARARGGRRDGRLAIRTMVSQWAQIERDVETAANKAVDAVNRLMP